ncbi:hypothetical protein, partial [Sansalvadorimonas verongulae]|uniref:hypothetical protein n=1 Tax=Sansalvadorimonas verongulae TaxID=2172824 RepID=UPI0012BCE3E1
MEQNEGLTINWDSVEQLFDPALLDSLFYAWETLLLTLATDADSWQRPCQPPLPDSDAHLWRTLNDTACLWPDAQTATLTSGFLAQARSHPRQTALVAE